MIDMATGKVTGTSSAQNLILGFIPTFFMMFNTTQVKMYLWQDEMTAAYAFKIETGSTANSVITSGGFTAYTGGSPTVSSGTTPAASTGITLGQTALANNDVGYYVAFR
jgi:hypothetical protein